MTFAQTQAAAVAADRAVIGRPYELGGNGPDTFDCSGLFHWGCVQAGMTWVGRYSSEAYALCGIPVSLNGPWQDNDALCLCIDGSPDISHMQVWAGDRVDVIEAPHTGAYVQEVTEWASTAPGGRYGGQIVAVRRLGSEPWYGTTLTESATQYPLGSGMRVWQACVGVTADGFFGPVTLAATQARQEVFSQTPTGIVTPALWRIVGLGTT